MSKKKAKLEGKAILFWIFVFGFYVVHSVHVFSLGKSEL